MSELRTVDVQEIVACAGEALSKVSSGAVKLDDVKVLSKDNRRNFIARVRRLTILQPRMCFRHRA